MKNYTSEVSPERSVAAIETLLVRVGARNISKEYDGGEVTAITFTIFIPETSIPVCIRLPADPDAAFAVLKKSRKKPPDVRGQQRLREQAKRTAWRLIYDWVAVQLSLIEMKQAEMLQVFLPYVRSSTGATFFEALKQSQYAALTYRGESPAGDGQAE